MDDSDDYFTDDFILDDQTLALLDEEEHKFTRIHTSTPRPTEGALPPAKRLKTGSGYRPGISVQRSNTLDELELPEISIREDGFYNAQPKNTSVVPGPSRAIPVQVKEKPQSSAGPVSRASKPPSTGRSSFTPQTRNVPPFSIHQIRQSSSAQTQRQNTHVSHITAQAQPTLAIDEQIEALRRQVEELRKENEKMQSSLQEAIDIRFAKEGEVTILRKGKEKSAQDHAAQIAKLKAAREETETKHQQAQRELKEDIERLKTQFTFKQHEMETAIRKPPWSVRSKKIISDPYPAPAPVPSQIKGWNQTSTTSGPSRLPADNHHPHFGETLNQSQRVRKSIPSSDRNLPAGFLTSPARPSSRHLAKGKGRERAEQTHASNSNMFFSNPIERPSQSISGGLPPSPPSSPFAGNLDNRNQKQVSTSINNEVDDNGVDFDMLDGTQADAKDAAPEEVEEAELLNWSIYLHQTILRHTASSSKLSTFHMLMQAMPLQSLPHSSVETYSSASARILDVLSIASTRDEWTYTVRTVCISLLQIAGLLVAANSIPALTALFSLLTCLTCTIPSFSPVLVSIRKDESDEDSPAEIVSIFCIIVQNFFTRFKDTKVEINPDIVFLARENMDLFESLCWQLPSDLESCLTLIVRSPQVFNILLDASQPPWLLKRSARSLVWLSARKSLFRVLLSFPEPEIRNENMTDFTKLPHIEALCSLLVDTSRGGPEITSMKESILTFFSMLSQSHLDALTILVESRTLVPSLVAYLTHSSTPLWEDDDLLRSSPFLASSTLRTINQTLFLLYMLIFGPEAAFNLRHKLQVTPSRQFNGITHMFIVTLGRLSYTDPPEWIAAKDKVELEHIAEMARELLDLVVEGPEGDSIWATYQEGPDQESEADDDEVEARRLDANEI